MSKTKLQINEELSMGEINRRIESLTHESEDLEYKARSLSSSGYFGLSILRLGEEAKKRRDIIDSLKAMRSEKMSAWR